MMLSKLNPFSGYLYYLSIFRRYIGNRIFVLFALSLVGVAADSVGIMMLLPQLKVQGPQNCPWVVGENAGQKKNAPINFTNRV